MNLRESLTTIVILLAATACDRTRTPPVATGPGSDSPAPASSAPASRDAASPAPAKPEVALVVIAPGAVELRNGTSTPARVSWNMAIEREGEPPSSRPAWSDAQMSTMTMTPKCFTPPPAEGCVTVPAQGSHKPLPWRGFLGCTQCLSCRANAPAAPGRYRIVAFDCDSNARYESEPVVVVAPGRLAGTLHVHAPPGEPNGIRIDNEGETTATFRTHVGVHRLNKSNAYEDTSDRSMLLSPDCYPDAGADACVTVAPHASLSALPYFGFKCARCAKCAAGAPARAGEYMFVVSRCDGGEPHRLRFVVDARGDIRSGDPSP